MAEDTKPCPVCGAEIKLVAKKCIHCGEFIEAREDIEPCPVCGEEVKLGAKKCKHCGELVGEPTRKVWRIFWRLFGWTGFRGKTLWDFLRLIIVPMILLGLGVWFNNSETSRRDRIEEDRSQEAALQAYLNEMTKLLLDWELRDARQGDEVWVLAQARTVTALRQLDETRRNILLGFLGTSGLIADLRLFDLENQGSVSELNAGRLSDALREHFRDHGVLLTPEALVIVEQEGRTWKIDDVGSVYWIRSDEWGTPGVFGDSVGILRGADLREADLRRAHLSFADLQGAHLLGADLSGAILYQADLSGAILLAADLRGAHLQGADLREANLRLADLRGVNYDDATFWPTDFTPPPDAVKWD